MKFIIAIIQPGRLEAVKEALARVEVFRLTIIDVQGRGGKRAKPKPTVATNLPSTLSARCNFRSP